MLTANQQLIPLGKVRNGFSTNFKYTLTNSSNEPIKISDITLGCGSCTTASVEKAHLQPQEVTTVFAQFTPKSTGSQVKSINIHYNDGKKLKLSFSAEVI